MKSVQEQGNAVRTDWETKWSMEEKRGFCQMEKMRQAVSEEECEQKVNR